MTGGNVNPYGQTRASKVEADTYDSAIQATRIAEIPSNLQMRIAYDASNRPQYYGYAERGLAEASTNWLLQKLVYDSTSARVISRTIAYDSWNNRTTATYA